MAGEIVPESRQRAIVESRKRGYLALGAAAGTVMLGFTLGFVPWGALGAGATLWLGWRWASHRIRSGIRF